MIETDFRGLFQKAAQGVTSPRAVVVLHRAGQEEQHAGDEPVRDHAEDRGVYPNVVSVVMPSMMIGCAIDEERDQAFHILLRVYSPARRR